MSSGYTRKIDTTIEQVRSIYSQLLEAIETKVNRIPSDTVWDVTKGTNNSTTAITTATNIINTNIANNNNKNNNTEGNERVTSTNTSTNTNISTNSMERVIQTVLQEYINEVVEMASSSLNVVDAAAETDGLSPAAAAAAANHEKNSNNNTILQQLLQQTQGKYVEPFDLELNERVRQKYQEWEELTVKVAQMRKLGPQRVNERYGSRQREFFDELDRQLETLAASASVTAADDDDEDDDGDGVGVGVGLGAKIAADGSVDGQGNSEEDVTAATATDASSIDTNLYIDSLRDLYETRGSISDVRNDTDKLRRLLSTLEAD